MRVRSTSWPRRPGMSRPLGGDRRWKQRLGRFQANAQSPGCPSLRVTPIAPLDTPNVYYQVHLSCPEFTVIGPRRAGYAGGPPLLSQRTRRVGYDPRRLMTRRTCSLKSSGAGTAGCNICSRATGKTRRKSLKPSQCATGQTKEIAVVETHHGPSGGGRSLTTGWA